MVLLILLVILNNLYCNDHCKMSEKMVVDVVGISG